MDDLAETRTPLRRSLALGFAIAVPVAVATVGVVYAIIAIPMYTLAQADPHGLDRPFFRTALTRVAIPIGAVIGVLVGSVVAMWYRRGGRLPTDRTPF
jgi:predicted membrane protein